MALPVSRLVGVAAWVAVSVTLACVRISDVTQPGVVERETSFDAEIRGMVDGDVTKEARGPAYGVVAVSLPEGWELKDVRSPDFAGRFRPVPMVGAVPWGERPGYRWWVYETPEIRDGAAYIGRAFQLLIRVRTARTPGDYMLMYAGGVVPSGSGNGAPRLISAGRGPSESVSRRITVP